jgi:aldehyde:ferredoxin oxidoreductase
VIGPAGELAIPYALILTDHGRVAGRTGMGAVMGAKNLKAVAVHGSGKVPVAEADSYAPLRLEANRALRSDPVSQVGRELGTGGVADYFDYLGLMPKKYYQLSHFDGAADVSGASIKEKMLVGVSACHGCVIACGRVVSLPAPDGQGGLILRAGKKQKGAEYETLVGFGPNLMLNDPAFATRMGDLCDRYGIDTISTSNTIGLAFLLFEQGRITAADTGGLRLEWGNAEAVEALVHQVGRKEWFGVRLAEGARQLGKYYGAEAEAVQVNGLEAAYHDPRGGSGMALVYATSPRGACHNQSDFFFVEIGQVDSALGLEMHARTDGAVKSPGVAHHQNWRTTSNALVMCLFANVAPESVAALASAATGVTYSVDDLLTCGERGFNLKRVINHRLGLKRESDTIPDAFRKPYQDSEDGFIPDFDAMLLAYYAARGWDLETGRPSAERLAALGLDWVEF